MSAPPNQATVGAFRGRVGHKAGGFIAKKFFHPTNLENQEKLWLAKEGKRLEELKQKELLTQREEEKRLELLRDEIFHNTGQVQSNQDFASRVADCKLSIEERQAVDEMKRRLNEINQNKSTDVRINVLSKFPEDVLEFGHSHVWGSWFDKEKQLWGYACCQLLDRTQHCTKRQH